jgi:hypothetical protein
MSPGSPAASATFALNAGVRGRRGRLLIISLDLLGPARPRAQAEAPLIVLRRFPGPAFLPLLSPRQWLDRILCPSCFDVARGGYGVRVCSQRPS